MDSITLRDRMCQQGISLTEAATLEDKQFAFDRTLVIIIPPKNQSDRTSFRRISNWLVQGCRDGQFDEHIIFRRVTDFALEASCPESRNPAAVFTAILKKELGYRKWAETDETSGWLSNRN